MRPLNCPTRPKATQFLLDLSVLDVNVLQYSEDSWFADLKRGMNKVSRVSKADKLQDVLPGLTLLSLLIGFGFYFFQETG